MTLNTRTAHMQKTVLLCEGVQLTSATTMSHGTYIQIMIQRILNYTTEIYI